MKPTLMKFAALAALAMTLVGCATYGRHQMHRANSLFKYLYPDKENHIDAPGIPTLSLPLRVGVAFVPQDSGPKRGHGDPGRADPTFSELDKMALLKKVSAEFQSYPFVKSIEIIPTAYLAPRGGFANLDQLQKIYGVDVIALVSFDQVQFTDQGLLSLTYWTILGAYLVQGEKNDTRTMLDGAVYDIASRKLLFRAPGISHVKGSATPINQSEELRMDSRRGFDLAAVNLVTNLQTQLAEFQVRVKNAPTEYKVVRKPGYTGAGSFGGLEVLLAIGVGGAALCARRIGRK